MRSLRPTNSVLAHGMLLAVVVVWGGTFPLVKAALQDVSPLLFNAVRMTLATLVLLAINLRQLRHASRSQVLSGCVAGVLLGAGYQFQTVGLASTTATKSALITGMVVVFVPVVSLVPLVSPRPSALSVSTSIAGSLLAFAGLALLTIAPATRVSGLLSGMNQGDMLTLLCAVAFAGHLLTLAKISPGIPAATLATTQVGFAATLMILCLPFSGNLRLHLTSRLVLAWLVTALLATAVAFTIQSWAQQHLPATHTAVLLSLEPVFALVAAWLFLGEHLSRRGAAGAGLMLAGLVVVECIALPKPIPPEPMG